ncbi:MAG: hypothetical protein CMJ52_03745 [Planctomycetaceae bacterium]|nr:hypothetical protein [Planctomycetaceae bacterium]
MSTSGIRPAHLAALGGTAPGDGRNRGASGSPAGGPRSRPGPTRHPTAERNAPADRDDRGGAVWWTNLVQGPIRTCPGGREHVGQESIRR